MALTPDTTAPIIVSLVSLGMVFSFVVADRRAPISRALALFLTMVGLSISLAVLIATPLHEIRYVPPWDGVFALPEALAFVFAAEWLLLVRRSVPAGAFNTRGADNFLRVAQGLAGFYGLVALLFPRPDLASVCSTYRHDHRSDDFYVRRRAVPRHPGPARPVSGPLHGTPSGRSRFWVSTTTQWALRLQPMAAPSRIRLAMVC